MSAVLVCWSFCCLHCCNDSVVPLCEEGMLLGWEEFKHGCCRPGQCSIFMDEESEWAVRVGEGPIWYVLPQGKNTCIQGHLLSQSVMNVIVKEMQFYLKISSHRILLGGSVGWKILGTSMMIGGHGMVNNGKEQHPKGFSTEVYVEAALMDEPTMSSKWDNDCHFTTFWCGRVDGSRYMINFSLLLLLRWKQCLQREIWAHNLLMEV